MTNKETMATLPNGWKVSQQVINLIADLDFEYDRMSRGGQKAYDTIWREGLFYKLLQKSISKKIVRL